MLSWLLHKKDVLAALAGELTEEEAVETRPERVPNSILDENVDIFLIRKYFSDDAWVMVESLLEHKRKGCVRYVTMISTPSHPLYAKLV